MINVTKKQAVIFFLLAWAAISTLVIGVGGFIANLGTQAAHVTVSETWSYAAVAGAVIYSAFAAAVLTFIAAIFKTVIGALTSKDGPRF